jgi:hypothetical protein
MTIPILGSIRDPFGLILLVVLALLFFAFYFLVRQGLKPDLRPLSGYDALLDQVGQAVESGGRVHVSLGSTGIVGEETATTLAGLAVLDLVSNASAISDRSPVATTADATALPLVADAIARLRQSGHAGEIRNHSSPAGGADPISLAGGVTSVVGGRAGSSNVLTGSFGRKPR